jgi:hypothetical protein
MFVVDVQAAPRAQAALKSAQLAAALGALYQGVELPAGKRVVPVPRTCRMLSGLPDDQQISVLSHARSPSMLGTVVMTIADVDP